MSGKSELLHQSFFFFLFFCTHIAHLLIYTDHVIQLKLDMKSISVLREDYDFVNSFRITSSVGPAFCHANLLLLNIWWTHGCTASPQAYK